MRNRAASSRIIILSWIIPLSPTRPSSRYLCTSGTVLVAADSCRSSADSESPRATAMCAIIADEIEGTVASATKFVQIQWDKLQVAWISGYQGRRNREISLYLSRLISINNFVYHIFDTMIQREGETTFLFLYRMVLSFFFFEMHKFDVAGEEGEKRRCSWGAASRWP